MKIYNVRVRHDGRWLLIQVPELDIVSQADHAHEVVDTAHDLIASWLDCETSDFDVRVVEWPDDVIPPGGQWGPSANYGNDDG